MRTWLITGVSSGFGRAIAKAALREGERVIGTVRKDADRMAFEALSADRAHALLLDVTNTEAIETAIADVGKTYGPIDLLVNNAGYGHEGLVDESGLEALRQQFEVNFFGAVAMIKAVLPSMRRRRAGFIINITSMGGLITLPGLAYYHASKFALEGFTESFGKEVRRLGIRVTAVEPGAFRTDWAGRSMVRAERSIADYDGLMDPIRERRLAYSGHQIGDPEKLGAVLLELSRMAEPPAHLLLGSDASQLVGEKLSSLIAEYENYQRLTLSTDFEDSAQSVH